MKNRCVFARTGLGSREVLKGQECGHEDLDSKWVIRGSWFVCRIEGDRISAEAEFDPTGGKSRDAQGI